MSQLFIRTLCQAPAARSVRGRLLSSTNIGVSKRAATSNEPNDLNAARVTQDHKVFESVDLGGPLVAPNRKDYHTALADSVLFTRGIVQPPRLESSDVKPDELASHKVLSSRYPVDKEDKASLEQLNYVADYLTRALPHFFSSHHPIHLYSRNLVFIDKTRNIRTQGIGAYNLQMALMKAYYTLNYTSNRVELLNLVKDPEESCVKIRWRVVSRPGLIRFALTFYKYHGTEYWKDAISTMYVNKEGKIYCHVCDNIDVEKDDGRVKKVVKNPLVSRGVHV